MRQPHARAAAPGASSTSGEGTAETDPKPPQLRLSYPHPVGITEGMKQLELRGRFWAGAISCLLCLLGSFSASIEAEAEYRWHTNSVTFCDRSGYGPAVRVAIRWWNTTPSSVRLHRAGCGRAKIKLHRYYRNSQRAAGYAWYPPDGRVFLNHYWLRKLARLGRADVIAHEIGHALGLPHLGGCALMNARGVLKGRGCQRPPGLFACGPQRRDVRELIRRYGGQLGDFEGTTCGERTPPRPPDSDPPTPSPTGPPPPTPPPSTHRFVVSFGPGDDEQRLYLNGSLVGVAGYGQSRTFDLGNRGAGDTIRIDLFNGTSGFVWNVRAVVNGVERYRAQQGTVGSYGACGNAQGPNQTVVMKIAFDYEGDVLSQQFPC